MATYGTVKVCNCLEDNKIGQIQMITLQEDLTISFGNSMVCVPAVKQSDPVSTMIASFIGSLRMQYICRELWSHPPGH